MQNLKNKKILFLDGLSNLYHYGLIKAFEDLGTIVTPIVYKDFMDRSLFSRIKKNIFQIKSTFYEKEFLDAIQGEYDIFFIKNPETISKNIFIKLKQLYPTTPFINYNWNTINLLDYTEYIPLFDKVYTFDPSDAKKYNLLYYPLFYLPEFEKIAITNNKKKYLLSFVGTAYTSGRAKFLSKFNKLIKDKNISSFQHLFASPKEYYTNVFFSNYNFKKIVTKRFFNQNELLDIYKRSLSFIDHPSVKQKGHTVRTFETLAAGLMLVTTNKALKDEPFFDSKRIQIIKDDLSDLDLDLVKNYKPSFPAGFEIYRVDNWLAKILLDSLQ